MKELQPVHQPVHVTAGPTRKKKGELLCGPVKGRTAVGRMK